MEWNKLNSNTQNSTYPVFWNRLLKIIQPASNPVYNFQNYIGLKLLIRLRLGWSHINMSMDLIIIFKILLLLCNCWLLEVESTVHFLLQYHHYHNIRAGFLTLVPMVPILTLVPIACASCSMLFILPKFSSF